MPVKTQQKRKKSETPRYLEELEDFFRESVRAEANRVSYKSLSPEALQACLELGFCHGDLKSLLRTCRDPNNEELDEEEIDDMLEALHENGTTINQPFCFAPGAVSYTHLTLPTKA